MNIFKLVAEVRAKVIIAQLPNSNNLMLTVINDGCLEQRQLTPDWIRETTSEQKQQFLEDLITMNKEKKAKVDAERVGEEANEE